MNIDFDWTVFVRHIGNFHSLDLEFSLFYAFGLLRLLGFAEVGALFAFGLRFDTILGGHRV